MIKFFQYLFTIIFVFGLFLFAAGIAGSHGHLQFRPGMTEDWVMFGTPDVGFLGLVFVTVWRIRKKE